MNLQQLNNKIHQASKEELVANFESWVGLIQTELETDRTKENYFVNHAGRELFRKLDHFDLNSLIKDHHDAGFRPQKFDLDRTSHRNSLSNITAWFDSEHVIMNGNKVTTLVDRSGNGQDLASQSNTANISNTENNLPTINIPGDDHFTHAGSRDYTNNPGNYLFYIVAKITTVNDSRDSLFSLGSAGGAAGSNFQLDARNTPRFEFSSRSNAFNGSGSTDTSTFSSVDQVGKFNLYRLLLDINTGLGTLSINGEENREDAFPFTFNLSSTLKMRVMSNIGGSTGQPSGEFGEFIMSSDLSMRDEIEFYLANKWGITLDASHAFHASSFQTINNVSWTPARISTLTWFDSSNAASFDLSGQDVIQWNDSSGNDNHAFQDLKATGGVALTNAHLAFKAVDANQETTIKLTASGASDANLVGSRVDAAGTNEITFTFGNQVTVQNLIDNTDVSSFVEVLGQGTLGSTLEARAKFSLTISSRPEKTTEGVEFDGSNDGLVLTNDISENDMSVFAVIKGDGYLFANNAEDRTLFLDSNQNLYWNLNDSTGQNAFNNKKVTGHNSANVQILEFSKHGTALLVRVNGVVGASLTTSGTTKKFNIDRIGMKWDGSTSVLTWGGNISEIIAVTSTTEREKIEGYLAHKWNLESELPSSHTYKNNPPTF